MEGKITVFTRRVINRLGREVRNIRLRKLDIQNNKIFFMTYDNAYSCNPHAIADEIIRRKLPYDLVWASSEDGSTDGCFPSEIRQVKRASREMFIEQATARIWIDNAINCLWYAVPKKKDQIYFNTWHGSMGIKRLSGNKRWLKRAGKCNATTDYCITNSQFEEDVFRSTFWKDTPFLKFGHARNDILFQTDQHSEISARVRQQLQIPEEDHVFLYAPTFRDDMSMDWFTLDFSQLRKDLCDRFGGTWTILIRLHFKNRDTDVFQKTKALYDFLKDAGTYPDMYELMITADVGCTDYSSWAYDYLLMRRPLFIYAPDLDRYNDTRGFYFPLETTPFPISKTSKEMSKQVRQFEETKYLVGVDRFLEEKGCYEAGTAAARIVDKIEEIISSS